MNEPLVLLPGMMCDARLFWPQLLHFGSRRAVMVAPVTGASSIGAIAASVLEAAPRRFALAGLSMGGIVAMEVLRRAPERVTRIALMDTNPLPETPQVAAAREPQIVAARTGRLLEVMREEMKPRYLAPGPRRSDVLSLVMEMAEALGPEIFISQSRALQRRPDQQKTLRTTRVPTLVLCGEHDALCPVKRHEFMAELIPNATLEIIPDAGHLPTLEQPDATSAALEAWLDSPLVLR
ncbi:pimeloyl-ACP methyl ester carboxylesterase [Aliiruegeria haliotis]|uniref:Pimeloyl-ACP methyl ester carboxylesterase n=1 Tax=Aliiruegeria haliotis TaxID=1280846 RepID=A0A2T0RWL3_9RHOB|nr:alpha/beta fold hydrolase [Aliiruegeria haliotis]PRY25537.1 pimeloyl-ACP methyl ester carboxylesterase [Aliiruegeria haliotis]